MNGYIGAMRRYATFQGRAARAEFWQFTLVQFLIGIVASIADVLLGFYPFAPLGAVATLVHLMPGISVSIRRLHDTARSGWWYWLWLIPIVGWLLLLIFFLQRGTVAPNTYGSKRSNGRADVHSAVLASGIASNSNVPSVRGVDRDAGPVAAIGVFALAIILIFGRIFLFQPFNIPSGAQIPSLLVGDYLFVSKYAYGYSKYSFPFKSNLFAGRILAALPQRGDIAVFKYPVDNSSDYIKRVIGLPGDTIAMKGEMLSINGEQATYEFVREYTDDLKDRHVYVYEETLPTGGRHLIQTIDRRVDAPGPAFSAAVAPATLFMLGDNRDDSSDSRFWGGVPVENLVGRAEVVYFSIKTVPGPQTGAEPETEPIWQFWRWPSTVRWERLFTRIH